jgi:ferredoxin
MMGVMASVRFEPSGRRVAVPAGSTILAAARKAGLPLARGCGAEGLCGRCGVRILGGAVDPESAGESAAKGRNRIDPALRLACRVRVRDEVTVTAAYW